VVSVLTVKKIEALQSFKNGLKKFTTIQTQHHTERRKIESGEKKKKKRWEWQTLQGADSVWVK